MIQHAAKRLHVVLQDGQVSPAPEGILKLKYGQAPCPFGVCRIADSPHGICHLSLVDEGEGEPPFDEIRRHWPDAHFSLDHAHAAKVAEDIFNHTPTAVNRRPLLLAGTPFQIAVWRALLEIPPGCKVSYHQLASRIGRSKATRAVGTAVGANPVAVLIPCHRVVRADGGLGGFRWGTARKAALLAWESRGI